MGSDIHAYVEVQNENGTWEWHCEIEINDKRNYGLFGFLVDACNISQVPPLSKPRGLPNDISADVKAEYLVWKEDSHSESYLSRDELLNFDYDQTFEDRRICSGGEGSNILPLGQGVLKTFREFLPQSFFEDLQKLSLVESRNVRVVFWFDY